LALLVLAGALAAASDRRPTEDSFHALRDARYSLPANGTEELRKAVTSFSGVLVLTDSSAECRVAWSRYVSHGPLALATVALKAGPKKLYEHRYLGLLGRWLPLPYLPQPGRGRGTYGVGACLLGRCVCVSRHGLRPKTLSSKAGKAGKAGKAAGAGEPEKEGCWSFKGGKSAALNVMAVPNMVLFAMWQWPRNWPLLGGHATLSLANLGRGRLWVLLAAPFLHRSWGEVFSSGVLLATAVDCFDRARVAFPVLLGLYLAGSWAAWLARTVLWRRLLRNDASAFYEQEWGASGGLAALMVFLARARPEERFSFSLYVIPTPLTLSAWQSLFPHVIMNLYMTRRSAWTEALAHAAAWAVGWAAYDAWAKHG